MPTHDTVNNRHGHLMDPINRIPAFTDAALSQAIIRNRGWIFPLPDEVLRKAKAAFAEQFNA